MTGQHLDPAGDCTGSLPLPKTSQIHCAFAPEYHRHLPGDSGRPLDLFSLSGEQEFIIFSIQRMDQSAWFSPGMRRVPFIRKDPNQHRFGTILILWENKNAIHLEWRGRRGSNPRPLA